MSIDQSKHQPGEGGAEAKITLNELHRLASLQRGNVRNVIADLQRGKSIDHYTPKEQIAAYEARIMDIIHANILAFRKENASVYGLGNTQGRSVDALLEGRTAIHNPENLRLQPITSDTLQELVTAFAVRPNETSAEFARLMGDVLLHHLIQWEDEMQQKMLRGTAIYKQQVAEYQSYRQLLLKHRFDVRQHSDDFPGARTMHIGFLFGQSLQWKLVGKFPGFARSALREPWNLQSCNTLFRALKAFTDKWANVHGVILSSSVETLRTALEQSVACVKVGNDAQFVLPAGLFAGLKQQMPAIEAMLDQAVEHYDSAEKDRVTTGCPAYFSQLFDGVREWIQQITEDVLVPKAADTR